MVHYIENATALAGRRHPGHSFSLGSFSHSGISRYFIHKPQLAPLDPRRRISYGSADADSGYLLSVDHMGRTNVS